MSKLISALREKYRTPEEALAALGLDADLLRRNDLSKRPVIGDSAAHNSKENTNMKLPTRFADLACRVSAAALLPLMARDQKFDLAPVFRDVTSKNFKAAKIRLAIDEMVKGKLSKDASTESMMPMLNSIEHAASPATADESVSPEQHRAMMAAAGGKSTLGIPEKVGEEFAKKDAGKTFDGEMHDQLCMFLEGKLSPEDMAAVKQMMTHQDAGMTDVNGTAGMDETPEMKAEKERSAADMAAKDAAAKDNKMRMDSMVSKTAMDSTLKAQAIAYDRKLEAAVKQARDETMRTTREIAAAVDEVRPIVGELPRLAFDSAEAVRREALKMAGVEGHDTIHESALSAILSRLPKAGARPTEMMAGDSADRGLAYDEAAVKHRDSIAPGRARIQLVN